MEILDLTDGKEAPKKERAKLSKIDKIVYGVIGGVIVFSIIGILWFGKDYVESKAEYAKLTEEYVQEQELSTENHLRWDIDWKTLYDINPDIVAWVIIPGTEVSYPVVQAVDNDVYLNTSFDGSKNQCGSIFMNAYNKSDFSDLNTVIYGHNMRNGSMFHTLNSYSDVNFYGEHNEVWICTPSWQRKYQIISAHITQDQSETYTYLFSSPEEYEAHVGNEVSQSMYDTNVTYDKSMPMVTLSTCRGLHSTRRMVLICQPEYEILVQ